MKQLHLIVQDCAYLEKQCYLLEMKANNKMKMHFQSNHSFVWPKKPYIEILMIVTTLATNEIKSRANHVTGRIFKSNNLKLTNFSLVFSLFQDLF